jgi:hypothetical protein
MNRAPRPPVIVCYVPGLDARRVDPSVTPYLAALRGQFPVVDIRTLPCTELVPTLLSGTWPHEHRVWQVSLRPEFRHARPPRLRDRLPDTLVTTAQCMRHFIDRTYDLPAIPARRLRRFDQHRFKYTRRETSTDGLAEFSGFPTIFGVLGSRSRYRFTKDFDSLSELARALPDSSRQLEFLEMYALDLMQHWHLDDAQRMGEALARTDRFVRDLHANCRRRGKRLVVLVDHGQERVVGKIPLVQTLRGSGIPEHEYSYFAELSAVRLWFHSERARRELPERIRALRHTTLFDWREMHRYNVCFEDDSFGEYYAFADAGWIFFPHDFYQPIGNVALGLMDWHQRRRALNPVHRGNHGYLPQNPSERGWMLVDDAALAARRTEGELIDVAPTLLSLAGARRPAHMKGAALYAGDGLGTEHLA